MDEYKLVVAQMFSLVIIIFCAGFYFRSLYDDKRNSVDDWVLYLALILALAVLITFIADNLIIE